MDVDPYKELAHYRGVKQKANQEFVWSTVYNYDVQFRFCLTLKKSARFHTINATLYTTMLDSSVVWKKGHVCQRCKLPNHLVRDCFFRAKSALEEIKIRRKLALARAQTQASKPTIGNTKSGSQATKPKAATYSSATLASKDLSANKPMFARLARRTTLWPIVNSLSDINYPLILIPG